MDDCLFCKIVNKEVFSKTFLENEKVVVFPDINPKAPVHLLIVPKEHISSVNDIQEDQKDLIGELFITAKEVAEKAGVKDLGYKLVLHVGEGGGQEIFHVHIHLMGGWK